MVRRYRSNIEGLNHNGSRNESAKADAKEDESAEAGAKEDESADLWSNVDLPFDLAPFDRLRAGRDLRQSGEFSNQATQTMNIDSCPRVCCWHRCLCAFTPRAF